MKKFFLQLSILSAFFFVAGASDASAQAFFDYDRRADLGVFRPTDSNWYSLSSESNQSTATRWGLATDTLVPGDYDGDGLTDFAVWRAEEGNWYVVHKRDGRVVTTNWGGRASTPFGSVDDVPTAADYDGDGQTDYAVWRPTTGVWSILASTSGFSPKYARYFTWGKLGDIPVPADYDGDGKADFAVFRSYENRWYIMPSASKTMSVFEFGSAGYDRLVPADYTGDDRADLAVYRNGTWIIRDSANGNVYTFEFGLATDIPVPADYNGDGIVDLGVFRNGVWYVYETAFRRMSVFYYGTAGDVPVSTISAKPSIVGVP